MSDKVINPTPDKGVSIKCKCGYEWITKSKMAYVSCPSCLSKIRQSPQSPQTLQSSQIGIVSSSMRLQNPDYAKFVDEIKADIAESGEDIPIPTYEQWWSLHYTPYSTKYK